MKIFATRYRRNGWCDCGAGMSSLLTNWSKCSTLLQNHKDEAGCDGHLAFDPVKHPSEQARTAGGEAMASLLIRDRTAGWSFSNVLKQGSALTAALFLCCAPAHAQESEIFPSGAMAVSGFPGTYIPGFEQGLPPGVDAIEETFIDPNRAVVRVFDVSSLGGGPSGQLVNTPLPFEVNAGQIGQVFGLAFDDGKREGADEIVPNLYVAASSLHGIQIVTPDDDDDGRAERTRRGKAGASFMEGQWGAALGGGPGTIWKIDGQTGQVSKFADIDSNSGPGLGNIAFDKRHRQFFVSDLDSGLIHRIGMDGAVIEAFDHGIDGRPSRELEPVSDDGAVMDIAGPGFDSEDIDSWGLTGDARRVWGVAVHGGRLYYAVGEAAEIWSVGIGIDGAFSGDARRELTVAADKNYPVTDIAFDNKGFMYLAQRGEVENRFDYSEMADSGKAMVLRYWRESPDDPDTPSIWVEAPQEYAVGLAPDHRQTAGGLDLQYQYDADGFFNFDSCSATLVKTGDGLRNDPALEERIGAGGPLAVHGVQITSTGLTRPSNEPPFGSWFVDYDGFFEDPEIKGHVGDVEVWRPCAGRAAFYEPIPYPGYPETGYPEPRWPEGGNDPDPGTKLCLALEAVEYYLEPGGLEADLYVEDVAGIDADSLKASSLTPGVSIDNLTPKGSGAPYTLGINGALAGDEVDVHLCLFKAADAEKGGYFPCCKVDVTLELPDPIVGP